MLFGKERAQFFDAIIDIEPPPSLNCNDENNHQQLFFFLREENIV